MKKYFTGYFRSPIGTIEIVADEKNLLELKYIDENKSGGSRNKIIRETKKQLEEYFKGTRKEFDLPLRFQGTDFQKTVWQALREIPYGTVVTYSDVAVMIGNPRVVRAVGLANNRNKLPIIVPCHRVIGKNGKLVGYSTGLWRKEFLIEHEAKSSFKGKEWE